MSKEYFSGLNYSLANEDTEVELFLLKENTKNVFTITGSGARSLPLSAKNSKELDVIDMSSTQNYLCELRHQAIKNLNYEEFLFLLGYRGALPGGKRQGSNRIELYERLNLSPAAKAYWDETKDGWCERGFILLGHWEKHFQKLGLLFRDYLQCDFSKVFEAQSIDEQKELYQKHWPHLRWKSFLRLAASEYVFNKFLYKGHFSGQEDRKTENRPPYQFVYEEFERIFHSQLVRNNYFMQVLFLGKIMYEEGLPCEAQRSTFEAVKSSNTQIQYHVGNLLDYLPKRPYDFVSLSDTISYLDPKDANQILQYMHPETLSGSRVVIRSFMKAPQEIDVRGWKRLEKEEKAAHDFDGTAVYQFHIFEKI